MVANPVTLEKLRQTLAQKTPFLSDGARHRSGIEAFDEFLGGGLPKGALSVLTGELGMGRLSLAAKACVHETQAGRPVAWIDGSRTLYPPALANMGVDLSRVLMVQKQSDKIAYAAEQIIECGAFGLVVMTGFERRLNPVRTRRLQTAAECGKTCGLLVLEPKVAGRIQNAALKLKLSRHQGGITIDVEKDRSGRAMGRKLKLVVGQTSTSA